MLETSASTELCSSDGSQGGTLSSFVQLLIVPEVPCQWLQTPTLHSPLLLLCVPLTLGSTQLIRCNLP